MAEDASNLRFKGFDTNARGALILLGLAVEQLRLFDKETADMLAQDHVAKLYSVLVRFITFTKNEEAMKLRSISQFSRLVELDIKGRDVIYELNRAARPSSSGFTLGSPQGLPIGRSESDQAGSSNVDKGKPSLQESIYRLYPSPGSPQTLAKGYSDGNATRMTSYVADSPSRIPTSSSGITTPRIGGHNGLPVSILKSSNPPTLAELCRDSEPVLPDTKRVTFKLDDDETKKGDDRSVSSPKDTSPGPIGQKPGNISPSKFASPRFGLRSLTMTNPRHPYVPADSSDGSSLLSPTTTSHSHASRNLGSNWRMSQGEDSLQRPSPDSRTKTWANIAAIPEEVDKSSTSFTDTFAATLATLPSTPDLEPETHHEQLRVLWICHLPVTWVLTDVGQMIKFGPIMSISLRTSKDGDELFGHCACVVFQRARTLDAFLRANGHIKTDKKNEIISIHDEITPTLAKAGLIQVGVPITPSAAAKWPEGVTFILGAPYKRDLEIMRMDETEVGLRRRLKVVRSRLFYSLGLAEFKRELYKLVGRDNIELFHFYNPGEATVVFTSVSVAEHAMQHIRKLAAKKDGTKWEGVDVSMVHDFNEAPPAKMWSQYQQSGKIGRIAGDSNNGVYTGPSVKGYD